MTKSCKVTIVRCHLAGVTSAQLTHTGRQDCSQLLEKPDPPHQTLWWWENSCLEEADPIIQMIVDGKGQSFSPRLLSLVGINNNTNVVSGTQKSDSK